MYLLDNPIQPYAWGSRTALAELRGASAPTPAPEAELWMGAHPLAPSRVRLDPSGAPVPLDRLIAEDPGRWLGSAVSLRHHAKLPFLLKVLAAAEPLSLQAHPSLARARQGFAEEEARGIPLGAAHRNYKDPNHKPEVLCALTPFEALYGFRAVPRTLDLLRSLSVGALSEVVEKLAAAPTERGLRWAFERLFSLGATERIALVSDVVHACAQHDGPWRPECQWAVKMAGLYPGDVGTVVALLMNRVTLRPGEAVYLPAGNLHAYLGGTGVELMASSDNVLRGGLTRKHVDVPELLRVLDFTPIPPEPLLPVKAGVEELYVTGTEDFRLSRIPLAGSATLTASGPQLLLCTRGTAHARHGGKGLQLNGGDACFVPPGSAQLELEGEAELFRATVG